MKISEARKIVSKLSRWFMFSQGITTEKPEPITEDLKTLIKAMDIVKRCNKKAMAKTGKHTIQTTMADRGIAALYVAANFTGDNPDTAEVLAIHGKNMVFCIDVDALPKEEGE